jgi:hypothetical protein
MRQTYATFWPSVIEPKAELWTRYRSKRLATDAARRNFGYVMSRNDQPEYGAFDRTTFKAGATMVVDFRVSR